MKTYLTGFLALSLCLNLTSVFAQPSRPGGMGGMGGARNGAQITAAMAKLFGENKAFSANVENEVQMSPGRGMTVPGKIAFDSGKARFEVNLSEAKGAAMPPQMGAQMKAMGMDQMITLSLPDQKTTYIIYPTLKAYAAMPDQTSATASQDSELKMETTELGKETIDGHPCIKNKAVVTDNEGKKHESTLWNATDLKNFPVKIETTEEGTAITMKFKDVKLSKPDAALFTPPANFKKYDDIMGLMQSEVMKRMQENGGAGMPQQ